MFARKSWLYIPLIQSLDFLIRGTLGTGSGPVPQSKTFCAPLHRLRHPKNIRFFITKSRHGRQPFFRLLFAPLKAFIDTQRSVSPRIELIVEEISEYPLEWAAKKALKALRIQDRVEITLKRGLEGRENPVEDSDGEHHDIQYFDDWVPGIVHSRSQPEGENSESDENSDSESDYALEDTDVGEDLDSL